MKKFLIAGLLIAVTGIIVAALVFKFYINKPHDDIEKAKPDYSMAANELWLLYTSEYKTADSLYTGKVIELSGTINRAEKSDSLVYVVFVMEADSMFGDKSVRCEMLQKYNDAASKIKADTPMKIKGFCTGFDDTDIKFNKCSIIQ